jgi:hypothetical protein
MVEPGPSLREEIILSGTSIRGRVAPVEPPAKPRDAAVDTTSGLDRHRSASVTDSSGWVEIAAMLWTVMIASFLLGLRRRRTGRGTLLA